jgi:GTP-binding protein
MKLAIVGKRNSGKSSIVNALARDKRVIVNELPGTTRDSVDVHFDFKGAQFVAIDTAGIQRGRSVANSVEFFSQARSLRAVRRADVVVLMMDCQETTTRLDRKLIDEAHEHLRPVIIAVNKWDLATNIEPERFTKYVSSKLPMLSHAPIVFCSAKTGLNVFNIAELAIDLHRQAHTRVSTGELNRTVAAAFDQHKPKARGGKPPKLFYATQTEVNPATIVCFVNDRELFRDEWREYLKNRLRQTLPIKEVPIKIIFRNRQKVVLEHQE